MPSRHRAAGRGVDRVFLTRRQALRWLCLPPAALAAACAGDAWGTAGRIASARLWPAQEYTRLILEAPQPIVHRLLLLKDPDRVVLELEGVELTPELARLASRLPLTDPFIAGIRFGSNRPGLLQVVIDLKVPAAPELFALPPVAAFGHRVVLDLYPLNPVDPLMALLDDRPPPSAEAIKAGGGKPDRRLAKQASGRRRITIALDPGHGGEDPGAVGRRGTFEKDVVLSIARKLKTMVDASSSMRAVLTRDDDYFVPLATRVQKARRVEADLLVSIHADAFTDPAARGSSVFALSEHGATSAAARWLAQRENGADLIGGVNLDGRDPLLARTLLDLSQTAQISDSLKVGRVMLDEIGSINALHKAAVEQAGFAVLKAPDIPSILVETAFISNPEEEQKLRSDRQQLRFAQSMHEGIRRYFANNPPLARASTATG